MLNRYDHAGVVWVDLESPTEEEVRRLMEEYHLDPLIAEELLIPSVKPKVEAHPGYIYLILHFPAFKHTHGSESNQEVDFIVGERFLITARYDTVDPLHKFAKVFEVHSLLAKGEPVPHGGMLLVQMLRKLYRAVEHELDFLRDEFADTERQVFAGREREMVVTLSKESRVLLDFKQALAMHGSVLESLEQSAGSRFDLTFPYHVRSVIGLHRRLAQEIGGVLDALQELRDTNNALLSAKQNEIMKAIAVMAFSMLPLTVITQVFSMNTVALPIIGNPFDFWIVIGIMLISTTLFIGYFKHRGWL